MLLPFLLAASFLLPLPCEATPDTASRDIAQLADKVKALAERTTPKENDTGDRHPLADIDSENSETSKDTKDDSWISVFSNKALLEQLINYGEYPNKTEVSELLRAAGLSSSEIEELLEQLAPTEPVATATTTPTATPTAATVTHTGKKAYRKIASTSRLVRHLFRDYQPDAAPRSPADFNATTGTHSPILVSVKLGVEKIVNVDELKKQLTISGWVGMSWNDKRLRWDPAEFSGITSIVIPSKYVWLPVLAMYEDAYSVLYKTFDKALPIYIGSSGDMSYYPSGYFTINCDIHISAFPRDTQHCDMTFTSWLYDSTSMLLYPSGDGVDCSIFNVDADWKYLGITVKTTHDKEDSVSISAGTKNFSEVKYTLHLERIWVKYAVNITIPLILLSACIVSFFLLRVDDDEKLSLNMLIMQALAFFHNLVSFFVPKSLSSIALLNIYADFLLALQIVVVVENIFIFRILDQAEIRKVPAWIWFVVTGPCGAQFCRGKKMDLEELENPEKAMLVVARENDFEDKSTSAEILRKKKQKRMAAKMKQRKESEPAAPTFSQFENIGDMMDDTTSTAETVVVHSRVERLAARRATHEELNPENKASSVDVDGLVMSRFKVRQCLGELRRVRRSEWMEVAMVADFYLFVIFLLISILVPIYVFIVVPELEELDSTGYISCEGLTRPG